VDCRPATTIMSQKSPKCTDPCYAAADWITQPESTLVLNGLKRFLVGQPLRTAQGIHERLTKRVALAVFASDALSSVAYATEEILLVLAVAAAYAHDRAPFFYVLPISLAIAILLWLLTSSYRQTIHAYPSGGGAYIVAKDNLGITAGLTAAAALLVDYVLTVSVSVAAGVEAVTSAAQGTDFAWLADHRATLCVGMIALGALANLRGIRESGSIFAVPTYLFLFSYLGMIAWGLAYFALNPSAAPAPVDPKHAEGYALQPLGMLLLLGAFANGCTALTGVEAISNGVPAFRQPESRNAATTLLWMALLLTVMFLGTSGLAYLYGVEPRQNETVISQFARIIFADPYMRWAYYLVQASTAAILVLAANTSFADFPRLASLMARDRFLPQQFTNVGDRLVFSNGILLLAFVSALLVWMFKGDTSRLIPLYAVGVFLSFTLSQAGMVRHWWREGKRPRTAAVTVRSGADPLEAHAGPPAVEESAAPDARGWQRSIVINGLGAVATALVLVVFLLTKFIHGAWIVVVVVPLLVLMFRAIHHYYVNINAQLQLGDVSLLVPEHSQVLIPIVRVHKGMIHVLEYALGLSPDVQAVYVEVDPVETDQVRRDWDRLRSGVPLKVLPSPYRAFVGVLLDYINVMEAARGDNVVTVLLPEFVTTHWWQQFLHNQPMFLLKTALMYRNGIVVSSVPYQVH
jgi:amino acid transporter